MSGRVEWAGRVGGWAGRVGGWAEWVAECRGKGGVGKEVRETGSAAR